MVLDSWAPYPDALCLSQEVWLKSKINNIEYGIKQVHKLYLEHVFKITHIYADSKFEPLRANMADLGISLNCASYK